MKCSRFTVASTVSVGNESSCFGSYPQIKFIIYNISCPLKNSHNFNRIMNRTIFGLVISISTSNSIGDDTGVIQFSR